LWRLYGAYAQARKEIVSPEAQSDAHLSSCIYPAASADERRGLNTRFNLRLIQAA